MTSIQPSLIPIYSSGASSASQLSADQSLLDSFDSQQNQNTANNIFGGAYSLDLSDAALGMFGSGGSDSSNPASDILNALTYSNFSNNSQGSDSIDALLGGVGSGSGPMVPTSLSGASFDAAEVADGGPLPAFLAYVDQAMNLSSTQQQSLQNIANENMNIPGDTPAVVQQIATELQQAGIPETI